MTSGHRLLQPPAPAILFKEGSPSIRFLLHLQNLWSLYITVCISESRAKFKLIVIVRLELRRIDALFRWNGALVEVRLQPAVSPQVQVDINREFMPFSVQIFPPGEIVTFGADMWFEMVFVDPEYRGGTIDLHNYLANRPEAAEIQLGDELSIWYRVEFDKLELAFTTLQYPALP